MRKFYIVYKDDHLKHISNNTISDTVSRKLKNTTKPDAALIKNSSIQISEPVARKLSLSPFKLSWTHYVVLLKIENPTERKFYEIEAAAENWGKRELKRQYDSAIFKRLALSRNKAKVKELGKKGHVIEKPSDTIKDPMILEFMGFKLKDFFTETDFETALIDKLEDFLLELGKGFLFVARQKGIKVDGVDYSIHLVFYHRILRCFVVIYLKIGTLTHGNLGQMQMYVNYYDEEIKDEEENKTIGIILCQNKKESTIKYTLGKGNKQIFASQYKTYFPEKQFLKLIRDE